MKTLNYLTEKVATGEGSLGKLVNDDQLYNSINELSANLNSVVAKLTQEKERSVNLSMMIGFIMMP